jgi:hypothetical protein
VKTVEESQTLERDRRTTLAESAAWASNPGNPPFYLDLPTKHGKEQADVVARYTANAPNAMLDAYALSLRKFKAIAMDIGLKDTLLDQNQEMDRLLTKFSITHSFSTYEGDHTSGIAERFEKNLLPFFSQQLAFGP